MTDTDTRLKPPDLVSISIEQDDYTDSPRSWDNLGTIAFVHRNSRMSDFADCMIEATWLDIFLEDGWGAMVDRIQQDVGATVVMPVEYGYYGVAEAMVPASENEFHGIIYDTHEGQTLTGLPNLGYAEKILESELEVLSNWISGDVYQYTISDSTGVIDGCGGYFDYPACMEAAQDEAKFYNSKRFKAWKANLDSWDAAPDTKTIPAEELVGNVKIEVDGIIYELASVYQSPTGHPVARLTKVKE